MPEIVLARAHAGEPLRRVARGANRGLIYLSTPVSENTPNGQSAADVGGVGFPAEDVFCFNSKAYEALVSIWQRRKVVPKEKWRQMALQRFVPQAV